jgi:hypothetical protein
MIRKIGDLYLGAAPYPENSPTYPTDPTIPFIPLIPSARRVLAGITACVGLGICGASAFVTGQVVTAKPSAPPGNDYSIKPIPSLTLRRYLYTYLIAQNVTDQFYIRTRDFDCLGSRSLRVVSLIPIY